MAKPPEIIDYMILANSTTEGLAEEVNIAINAGWIPLGGVSAAHDHVYQAMVKEF